MFDIIELTIIILISDTQKRNSSCLTTIPTNYHV